MISYLLHSSLLISGFLFCYHFILSKETFFSANRWVLLIGLFLSFVLPLISIPESWSLSHVINERSSSATSYESAAISDLGRIHDSVLRKQHMEDEVRMELRATEEVSPAELSTLSSLPLVIDWTGVLYRVYLIGLMLFILLFLMQVGRIIYFIVTGKSKRTGSYILIEHPGLSSSFSFINMIFIRPHSFDDVTYRQIIDHEAVHVQDRHSYDMLLAELLLIVQWYNPFAWMYKKAIENNLEFITDHQMIHRGVDAQQYQMSLVRVAIPSHTLSLVNNYNQSFLKKRIIMMNAQKSSLRNSWKYLLLFPLAGLSMSCLNNVKAQNEPPAPPPPPAAVSAPVPPPPPAAPPVTPSRDSRTTIPAPPSPPAPASPRAPEAPKVPRKGSNIAMHINGHNDVDVSSGTWSAENRANQVCFEFDAGKKNHQWQWSDCWTQAEFGDISKLSSGPITITREAGVLSLNGKYSNGKVSGEFKFTPSEKFQSIVKSAAKDALSDATMIHLFISDFNMAYMNYLASTGMALSGEGIVALVVHDVRMEECKGYIEQLKSAGLTTNDLDDLVKFKIHGIDANYISDLKKAGIKDLTVESILMLSIHDVDIDYLTAIEQSGLKNLSTEEITQYAIHDVDPATIKGFKESGMKDLSTQDMIQFAIHDIDIDYLRAFDKEDMKSLTKDELIQYAIHDVEPKYIVDMKKLGFKSLSNGDIIQCHIHDVNPSEVKNIMDLGFRNESFREFIDLSIHGITSDDIKKVMAAGHKNKSLREYRDMIISSQY